VLKLEQRVNCGAGGMKLVGSNSFYQIIPAQELQESKHPMNSTSVARRNRYCKAQVSGSLRCSKIREGMASTVDLSGKKSLPKQSKLIMFNFVGGRRELNDRN
jgi:hypothetical protein